MSWKKSDETKRRLGYGTGEGADYHTYITTSEFNSRGTTSVIIDWKTGRDVHCLSQGEEEYYYILRWDDENVDIREQIPLDPGETRAIAEKEGIRPPNHIMTTDFLVTRADGTLRAYSVKPDRHLDDRALQLQYIEQKYWETKGATFLIIFKEDVNEIFASNIRLVTLYYDPASVHDLYGAVKHLIATKKVTVDMEHQILTNDRIDIFIEEYGKDYFLKGVNE